MFCFFISDCRRRVPFILGGLLDSPSVLAWIRKIQIIRFSLRWGRDRNGQRRFFHHCGMNPFFPILLSLAFYEFFFSWHKGGGDRDSWVVMKFRFHSLFRRFAKNNEWISSFVTLPTPVPGFLWTYARRYPVAEGWLKM